MKIGKQSDPASAICGSNAAQIIIRGRDLCAELIGSISFTEHFWLLVTGNRPQPKQLWMLDATLVAIAEHGLVPSVQTARMTFAAAPESMQGAVAAGIAGVGSVIAGSAENAGRFLVSLLAQAEGSVSLAEAASKVITDLRARRQPIPGYGHPLHKAQDPRVQRLLQLAEENQIAGRHIAAARAAETAIPGILGKQLMMNVSVAIPAVLLDAGFPLEGMRGVPILARAASLVAHLVEEAAHPIGFVLSEHGERAIRYSGPAPDGFVLET
jgi:citrate synthase